MYKKQIVGQTTLLLWPLVKGLNVTVSWYKTINSLIYKNDCQQTLMDSFLIIITFCNFMPRLPGCLKVYYQTPLTTACNRHPYQKTTLGHWSVNCLCCSS